MNILVKTAEGHIIARPDTTIDKENGDIFVPAGVSILGYTPALFARISKAGKAVSADFADRYFDSIAFGVLIYPSDSGDRYCLATGSCFDHTTLLPYPLFGKITLENTENTFALEKDCKTIFHCNTKGLKEKIQRAIVDCSAHSSIRIGDFVALELSGIQALLTEAEGECSLSSSFCENKNIEIRINY